jgi:DNA-binding response OmpR family regulator/DNA-binding CsgD family transcriptional regulator
LGHQGDREGADLFYPLIFVALVFVVDDEPALCDLVRLNLELDGHEVEVAGDGAEALKAVADGLRPDLVLLDLMMPKVDGWEVLRRLKADPDADVASTPVVLITARTSDMDRIRGGIEGALCYLTKPFEVGVLTRVVAEAIAADEAEARLAAQTSALQHMVRLERGEAVESAPPAPLVGDDRHVRFSRLERAPDRPVAATDPVATAPDLDLSRLSPKQVEVLEAVGGHPTVRVASASLGVSRSNVYASLRRIASKLHVASVHELVALARQRAA